MKASRFLPTSIPMRVALISAATFGVIAVAQNAPRKSSVSAGLTAKAKEVVEADAVRLQDIFKDIHQNPELGFMEVRTAGIVAKELQALGYEVKTGIGKTGVVGVLKNGDGPVVMYRADMDANAVEEGTGLPYASKVRVKRDDGIEVPVAHMCGHDAHTTWMLGVAKAMAALKDKWSGTFIAVGQPAEEPITGAQAMIDDGLYAKHGVPVPDFLLGLHTAPGPVGMIVSAPGTRMAGTDQIDVTFHGRGGHGSRPHETKDPVVMSAAAIMQYQTIVSRVVDPTETAVITVGSVQAGTDNNVIPESSLLKVNLRFFNLAVRDQMIAGIQSINRGIAGTYGMPEDQMPTLVMKGHSPPLVNDPELVARLRPALVDVVGEKGLVENFPAATGSEDFHLLAGGNKDVKIAYLFVGIADPAEFAAAQKAGKMFPFSAHSPDYKVSLDAIPFGTRVGLTTVLDVMAKDGDE